MRSAIGAFSDGDRHPVESVRTAGVHVELDRRTRRGDAARVRDVLVAEDVEVAHVDVGRRESGHVVGACRCRGRTARASVPIAVAEQRVPARVVVVVRPRRERRELGIGQSSCGRRASGTRGSAGRAGTPRSRASSATPAASPPPALSPMTSTRAGSTRSSSVCSTSQSQAGEAVLDRGGMGMLGCDPVLDREERHPRVGDVPGDEPVVHRHRSQDHAAAVQEDDRRARRSRSGLGSYQRTSDLGAVVRRDRRGRCRATSGCSGSDRVEERRVLLRPARAACASRRAEPASRGGASSVMAT